MAVTDIIEGVWHFDLASCSLKCQLVLQCGQVVLEEIFEHLKGITMEKNYQSKAFPELCGEYGEQVLAEVASGCVEGKNIAGRSQTVGLGKLVYWYA